MAEFKLVISDPKKGKSLQREIKEDTAKALIGKKIKEVFKGELIDLPGYEFQVTGGSDSAGFPMRWDVLGSNRKQITAVKGVGVMNKLRKPNPKKKGWRTMRGMRLKKTVAGNTICENIAQVNLKITKEGRESLFEVKEEPKKEEPKKEPKKEELKEEPKKEEVKEEPKKEEPKKEPADDKVEKLDEEIEKIDEEVAKDEKEIAKEDKEIEEIEKELEKKE
ncbi:30S ribosomal protein S6e [Candidatus Woesearchaeota archaeon]|nr:30S ribosomal protein S6e [Candidatus Woesearchaeota archaeon]